MSNPWLGIPLRDYEGHMNSVAQLEALADLFQEALAAVRPASLAILGIAGGNGLDRVDPCLTSRILGIDIHPDYLDSARERYPDLPLTLIRADLEREAVKAPAVDMVHAALVFEHAGAGQCLRNAVSLVADGGFLSVVLQLPSTTQADVAPSPFPAMQSLARHFRLIDPAELIAAVEPEGFLLHCDRRRDLPGGKAFWLAVFKRSTPAKL